MWNVFHPYSYELARWLFLRILGISYFFAYYSLARQVKPLLGEEGLTPAKQYLQQLQKRFDNKGKAFWHHPTLFWHTISDTLLQTLAWIGVVLSALVVFGVENAIVLFLLWLVYLSFVHVGQVWYGYGWESQLLETGFLAIFMTPVTHVVPQFSMSYVYVALLWWLTFRIHVGSGLIKLKADSCWKDLSCLDYHFETQPIPNPLSPYFHNLPDWLLRTGTALTHVVQLVLPFLILGPRPLRITAGIGLIIFQLMLMLSGNLSFLNVVTIAPIVACFDDAFLQFFLPSFITDLATNLPHSPVNMYIGFLLAGVVAWLSIPVVQNFFRSRQLMNASFNQFKLVNTYGAFGSVGRERRELVVQGTQDSVITDKTIWREYEFPAKPTDPERSLPVIAPYQPRVDWQIWFAAMQSPQRNPWLLHLVWKLLHNESYGLDVIAENPFPETPPEYVKIDLYVYEFAPLSSEKVWEREKRGEWLPPSSVDSLRPVARRQGWTPSPNEG